MLQHPIGNIGYLDTQADLLFIAVGDFLIPIPAEEIDLSVWSRAELTEDKVLTYNM